MVPAVRPVVTVRVSVPPSVLTCTVEAPSVDDREARDLDGVGDLRVGRPP